ncbi:MAG: hypothetical protein AB7U98_02815 [Candidatus Nitrosocosmicus sp.]|uniref:hypothetical protein n=1 Tax=Candidatus Nitrosocosmicus sp. FF01 TaxID=3397670 RepID=UPI0039EB5472
MVGEIFQAVLQLIVSYHRRACVGYDDGNNLLVKLSVNKVTIKISMWYSTISLGKSISAGCLCL